MVPIQDVSMMIHQQRYFFETGITLPITFRIQQLELLKSILQTHEAEIITALKLDLNKAPNESMLTELLLIKKEIEYVIKHLKKWARPKKVFTPLFLWPGRSVIRSEPYGIVLIIAPWNYPFMLTISPLIGAISAGNCVVVKPSEIAVHTHELILNLIQKYFPSEYICALSAAPNQMPAILSEKFDYIFFTGSTKIGKLVMEAAAKQLTPVTLELGGKNPCIVDETANLNFAARRIVWAKFLNAGQTCIAPDYLYIHINCKQALLKKIIATIEQFYSPHPETSNSYSRVINKHHFQRLTALSQCGNILYGGKIDQEKLYISPTLLDNITWSDPIMQEEIFGPLLPILTYEHINQVIAEIKSRPKPLAAYLFTQNKTNEIKFLSQFSSGGFCINDCLTQFVNYYLPFGGIGQSGMGRYHGKTSFKTFSHYKSIYKKTILIDTKFEYPPYSNRKLKWVRRLITWL